MLMGIVPRKCLNNTKLMLLQTLLHLMTGCCRWIKNAVYLILLGSAFFQSRTVRSNTEMDIDQHFNNVVDKTNKDTIKTLDGILS